MKVKFHRWRREWLRQLLFNESGVVTYASGLKNTRMAAVLTAIDAGAGAAKLEIGTSGMASVLVTLTLNDPAGTVTADVLTLDNTPVPTGTAVAAGTAAEARIRTSADADVVTGLTVGTSGQNIVINNVTIAINDIVNLISGTITHG